MVTVIITNRFTREVIELYQTNYVYQAKSTLLCKDLHQTENPLRYDSIFAVGEMRLDQEPLYQDEV